MHLFVLIFVAGFIAGAMNAAAGGGSFVTVPALIWAGVPPVSANMSSTVALYPGSIASAWGYRQNRTSFLRISLKSLLLITLVGGLCGALLLLLTPNHSFDKMIPWLLLFGSVVFAVGGNRRFAESFHRAGPLALAAIQFLLGVYGGYFGGAVGIMMMAAWSLMGVRDPQVMNPTKVLLVASANTAAVLCFVLLGTLAWANTIIMLVGSVLGAYLGTWSALRMDARRLRWAICGINFVMTGAFFWFKFR